MASQRERDASTAVEAVVALEEAPDDTAQQATAGQDKSKQKREEQAQEGMGAPFGLAL